MTADIVSARWAHTVTAPIAVRVDKTVQQRIIGVNGSALTHGHVVRRIEAGCTNITNCTRQSSLAVNRIGTTKCIAVILHQPQIILIAECTNRSQIKRVTQCMCDHNRLRLLAACRFQLRNINVVLWNCYIDKHRHRAILKNRRNCCRKSCGYGDDFITSLDTAFAKLRSSQRRKSD